ncbi:MAG TPA: cupin domain-containing protein [Firmicutes bacterium]|nr:cupin domain-containing protein [Bacillota bacterium]
MIRKADEMEKETREHMRGGAGTVEFRHLFRESELKGRARLCAHLRLRPGSSIGFHRHDDEQEIFYILSGRAVVDDDGTRREVAAGDAVLTGGGAGHAIEAIGDEPLEFLAIIIRACPAPA